MSLTREERKRYNRRWFVVRLVAFLVAVAAFLLLVVGTGYLADAAVAMTWKG